MPGRLTVQSGERTGLALMLLDTVTAIGRAPENNLIIPDNGVSGRHAEVRWDGQDYLLVDLESKNGTWLNGARLTAPAPLRNGDVITLPGRPPIQLRFDTVKETVTIGLEDVEAALPVEHAGSPPQRPTVARSDQNLVIDTRTAQVWSRGQAVALTAKEYQALLVLYQSDGALVSRHDLAQAVWPEYGGVVGEQNIEQLVYRLRRKLEAEPERPRHLITVRGLGYRLVLGP